jgi:amino acid adenylation domain-containing protein/FkbM family methyltransferase
MDEGTDSFRQRKEALARAVRAVRSRTQLPLLPRGTAEALPALSYAQERLWVLDQAGMAGSAYNVPMALRLRGKLDVDALQQAFAEIVRRHESLRTRIAVDGERAVQRIEPPRMFALERVNLRILAAQTREKEAQRLLQAQLEEPFDLYRGPLLRVQLLELDDTLHVLLVTIHHIVSDGWSLGILKKELSALYEAYIHEQPSPLPDLPIQYADYAIWQRQWLLGEQLQQHLRHWKTHLDGAPPLLELPCDRIRPVTQSYRGRAHEFRLDRRLSKQLEELARREGATLFMVLLAAFKVMLWRLSGQRDIVVGTPIAGRAQWQTQDLIGLFVNTLALRTQLSAQNTFREHLLQVKRAALAGFAQQELPFERVVQELQPLRDPSRQPIFQVLFALQNTPQEALELPGLQLEGLAGEWVSAKFDLSLVLQNSSQGLLAGIEYAADLFDRTTIERWADHFTNLLEQIVGEPQALLQKLILLRPDQRAHILVEWNRTERSFPRDCSVPEVFERWAQQTPDALAVLADKGQLTYGELNQKANQLAHFLREAGVGHGARVAICAGRTLDLVVAFLGVLKSGAGYVPLDPAFPPARLAHLSKDSAPVLVLTQGEGRAAFSEAATGLRCVDLELDSRLWAGCPTRDPSALAGTSGNSLAYVIYTSGSTGTPKGVEVRHRAVSRLVINNEYADLNAADCVAFAANPAFDASTFEVWAPLLNGGRVAVIDQAVLLDPGRFAAALLHHSVTAIFLTVGLFNQYAGALTAVIPRLRYLMVGGEALDPQVITRVWAGYRPHHLFNVYGPTETTTFATFYEITEAPAADRTIPIGRPISNTRLYILDEELEPVPIGVVGELFIGGDGVACGYLGRPELTAERFIPDRFGEQAGQRLYRTGDLVRYLPDGNVEFIGRKDQQIKIRGYRIELGEIEAALQRHPAVRQVAVLARESATGKQLTAYVVKEADAGAVGTMLLREHLLRLLPDYMIPTAFMELQDLPLTANGKLDRKALPAPDQISVADREYAAPVAQTETALARIWAEVLKVERVGREDNFFELGGHSLLAVTLVGRLRRGLGLEVAVRDLFTHPVLWALARALEGRAQSELAPLVMGSRHPLLPLSFAQQRLWFLAQIEGGSEAYHIAAALRLRGRLDRVALRSALDRIVERHEALRTSFEWAGDQPVQRIAPPESGFALQEQDLGGCTDDELEQRLSAEQRRPFDLERGPLIRGQVLRLSGDEHVLAITMHHIVSDGWSIGIMVNELSALYQAYASGRDDPLAPLPIQYADYALWQRQGMDDAAHRRQLDYWKAALQGAPPLLELPTDRTRPPQQSFAGDAVPVELDANLTRDLKALCHRRGMTLYMVVLAAWAAVLSRLSGQEEVVIGTPVANRTRADLEGLIGFFVNLQGLRVAVSGSLAEVLERVKVRALDAQANQDVPFEQVVEILQPPRSVAYAPVFQALLAWQNNDLGALDLPGLQLAPLPMPYEITKFDLELVLGDAGERVVGTLGYATALFDRETVRRQAGYLRRILSAMVADDQQPVRRVDVLDAAERHRLLVSWNDTAREYPRDRCIHELFEDQVGRTPDAIAVVELGRTLDYAQLNERANQLAHYLRRLGVEPDSRIALCMERGLEMVVSILAVLKSGGAYVPMEPEYPPERLRSMLVDSAPTVLLVDGAGRRALEQAHGKGSGRAVMLDVQADAAQWAGMPRGDLAPARAGARDLAYVIYTSGSTGRPKGVMNEHRGVVNRLLWMQEAHSLGEHDVVLQKTPFSFDVSVWEFFWPLMVGARLVMARPGGHKDPDYLSELIHRAGVTTLHFVPSMLRAFLDQGAAAGCRSVKRVMCSGEALPAALASSFNEQLPWAQLHNLYGPTEAAVDVSAWHCVAGDERLSIPIGRPIANTQLYILDEWLQPLPLGVAGELFIGGVQVARGYLNQPELTAQRFIPDPIGREPQGCLYRTGDLARWRSDAAIEYLGRNDHQVKIRGFRIELDEIEAQVLACPGVGACTVLAREDRAGEKCLVAYLVPSSSHASPVLKMLQMKRSGLDVAQKTHELPNGLTVFHRNAGETQFLYQEIFADQGYLRHGITVHDGDCIVDVGANIGMFSLFVGQRCRDVTIYAFEPIPPVFRSLQLNANLYELNGKVFECGLSDQPGEASFTFYPHNTIISSSATTRAEARQVVESFLLSQQPVGEGVTDDVSVSQLVDTRLQAEQYTCRLRTLSEIIDENQIERIDLLKIDVENAEQAVLQGISDFHWPRIHRVVVEVHDVSDRLAHISGLLESRGFAVRYEQETLLQHTKIYNLYAVRANAQQAAPAVAGTSHRTTWTWTNQNALIRDVRASLSRHLPEYMVPAAFVVLESLPVTSNGKLDRKALPPPDHTSVVRRGYEVPVGETETALARIWSEVLKVERVGREDDFFELGGHSLLALRLIAAMKRAEIEANVIDVLNYPTVKSLAECVRVAEAGAIAGRALRVRDGSLTPLFFAHDGYGDQSYVRQLARYLPADLPIYSLPCVPATETPLETIEEMAARLIELIREAQPKGPYRLAGWSFGGLLVYEVAQQLRERGARVEFVGLLDTVCPEGLAIDAPAERSPSEVLTAHMRAMYRYRPRANHRPVNLLLASEPPSASSIGQSSSWEKYISPALLNVTHVPGNHWSMMKSPHIQALGQHLTRALASALREAAA